MASFDEQIEAVVQDCTLSGVILFAKDKSGQLDYSKILGTSDIRPGRGRPLQPDSILLLASATKLFTSIALLQLVERGVLRLDDNVEDYLPVLTKQDILTGFEDGEPILNTRENLITLRHLLSHSAGAGYDFKETLLQQFQVSRRKAIFTGDSIDVRFNYPLLYEPGEGWLYSPGLDWAGQVLEKVTGQTLDEYMKENMWAPLGIKDISFWPNTPEVAGKRWEMAMRDNSSGKAIPHVGRDPNKGLKECFGGQGAYASMQDYMKILYSLLVDDEKLLRRETAAMLFQPQLSKASTRALAREMKNSEWAVGNYPDTGEYNWSLGGLLVDGDSHEHRKKGCLMWAGSPSIFWWIDREAGLCGVFGAQIMPPCDKISQHLIQAFEDEMYARVASLKDKQK